MHMAAARKRVKKSSEKVPIKVSKVDGVVEEINRSVEMDWRSWG
jgi:hypothetical protein